MIGLVVGIIGGIFGAFGLCASVRKFVESSLVWWKFLLALALSGFLIIEGTVFVLDFF